MVEDEIEESNMLILSNRTPLNSKAFLTRFLPKVNSSSVMVVVTYLWTIVNVYLDEGLKVAIFMKQREPRLGRPFASSAMIFCRTLEINVNGGNA
ncbi:hypothetical protein JTB14_031891 [Gonioctena quinquepunctata]|nr:hypothetical protein JTB14_031891 [Gonioctena quinquepunctata]